MSKKKKIEKARNLIGKYDAWARERSEGTDMHEYYYQLAARMCMTALRLLFKRKGKNDLSTLR